MKRLTVAILMLFVAGAFLLAYEKPPEDATNLNLKFPDGRNYRVLISVEEPTCVVLEKGGVEFGEACTEDKQICIDHGIPCPKGE